MRNLKWLEINFTFFKILFLTMLKVKKEYLKRNLLPLDAKWIDKREQRGHI